MNKEQITNSLHNFRKIAADNILEHIEKYLTDAGWTYDPITFFRVDPITMAKYSQDTAFSVQLGRDYTSQ